MKTIKNFSICISIFCAIYSTQAQGFVNLDFESAQLSGYSPDSFVPTTDAIPGWTAIYFSSFSGYTNTTSSIGYDAITLGGALIMINDANYIYGSAPLQGQYSLYFQGDYNPTVAPGNDTASEIAQTGFIPVTAQSLVFWGNLSGVEVTFNGKPISYAATGSGSNYTIYSADISNFSGQTGILGFTAFENGGGMLDNIQFSTSAVPEPSEFVLGVFGLLLLGLRRWQ